MTVGLWIALVLITVIIVGLTIWVTNKAYGRKPDPIDPMPADKEKSTGELR